MTSRTLYSNIVLGGTFDRLHDGHSILLQTAIRVAQTISIGLTSSQYLKLFPKNYSSIIYPFENRLENLISFIISIDSDANFYIFPIDHPWDNFSSKNANLDSIIVSEETLSSVRKINSLRIKKGLKNLKTVIIPGIISESGTNLSSTSIRKKISANPKP